jgi:deoxyribodipyrimidine photo-lyase
VTDLLPPTRGAALTRIAKVQPAAYARTRNRLEGAVTGLSPYITHGVVTLREVLAVVLQREPLDVQHKLVFELGWREFFRHVWSHRGDEILQSLPAGPRPAVAIGSCRWAPRHHKEPSRDERTELC